jgi:hypothetical protein
MTSLSLESLTRTGGLGAARPGSGVRSSVAKARVAYLIQPPVVALVYVVLSTNCANTVVPRVRGKAPAEVSQTKEGVSESRDDEHLDGFREKR